MGWNRENRTLIEDAVRLHENFDHASASGERSPMLPIDPGRLNEEQRGYLENDSPQIEYVVRSYATPIGWALKDGTHVVVGQHFSMTTATLQALLRNEWHCDRNVVG